MPIAARPTPKPRRLPQAQIASGGSSLLTSGQAQFASEFSRQTGLNPRVVGAWLLAEQSGDAAKRYQAQGYHNWLNIARTDSNLNAPGSHGGYFRDPITAARASAQWMRGQGPIAASYGHPAAGIQAILRAGGDPARQIQAIARSGWASSGYNGGRDLTQLYGRLAGTAFPSSAPGASPAPMGSRVSVPAALDPTTLGRLVAMAQARPMMGSLLQDPSFSSRYSLATPQDARQIVTQTPNTAQQDMAKSVLSALQQSGSLTGRQVTVPLPAGAGGAQAGAGGATGPLQDYYQHPFPGAVVVPRREDSGVDYLVNGPIRAIGKARVVFNGSYSGFGPYLAYQLLEGPHAGHVIYVSEGMTPFVKPGQVVGRGHVIAAGHGAIETGFGQLGNGYLPLAHQYGGYKEGQRTAAAVAFDRLMAALGVPRGLSQGRPVVGRVPAGY